MQSSGSFLFVTWDGGGNVPPVLGLARRMAARGHAVRVLTEPSLREAVQRAGAAFLAFDEHFTRRDASQDLLRDSAALTPAGALKHTFGNVVLGPARAVALATSAAMRATPTDVVVADVLMPGALAAAEAAGVARVALFHMPEYLPGPGRPAAGPGLLPRAGLLGRLRDAAVTRLFYQALRPHVGAYNAAREVCGLAPLRSAEDVVNEYHRADLRLIQTSEAFDFPITPAPTNVRYVGPVLDDPDWAAGTWSGPWPADDRRPLVVVGLSSTFQRQGAILRRVARALGSLDVRGLITLGPSMAEERLDLPPNVVAVPAVAHTAVFPHAAAVVTHAGHGTVMRALAHGLPLVCIPMGRDQDDNAARVLHRGAGLRLRRSASARAIAAALRRVLTEPAFREKAGALGRSIVADANADRAVAELESLITASGARRPAPTPSLGRVNAA